jgi:hypothetical protein
VIINLTLSVEVERVQGKFVSKDALAEAIQEELGEASTLYVEDSEYEVLDWQVEMVDTKAAKPMVSP